MDKEVIKRRYDLVSTNTYKDLRKEYLEFILEKASSSVDDKLLRGMMLLLQESDSWEERYKSAVINYNEGKV